MATRVDIGTGEPQERAVARKEAEKLRKEDVSLREKASFVNVVNSDAGQKLIAFMAERLQKRIEILIRDDEVAAAYRDMLEALGAKQNQAEKAVAILYKRQFNKPYVGKRKGRFKSIF